MIETVTKIHLIVDTDFYWWQKHLQQTNYTTRYS